MSSGWRLPDNAAEAPMPEAPMPEAPGRTSKDVPQAAIAAQANPLSLRILVAEDNRTNQAVIGAMLTKLGHRVDIVANGLEAVAAVKERPYDIVLMDVMMPEMDGVEATRAIRNASGPASAIPIIAVTADATPEGHLAYYAAGMRAVVLKPVTLSGLKSALAELGV